MADELQQDDGRRASTHFREPENLSDEAVLQRLRDRLQGGVSSLIENNLLDRGLEAQAISIIQEVRVNLQNLMAAHPGPASVEYGRPEDLLAHGELSAMQGVSPSEALMAGEALFESLIDVLESCDRFRSKLPDLLIARTVHHAVWRRFAPGASAYVSHLRQQLQDAHFEGRRRYSRFLHDQLAHDIAAAIQRLELSIAERPTDEYMNTALQIMRATLASARDFAFDVRQQVSPDGLEEAISTYIADCATTVPIALTRDGEQSHLVPTMSQEVFTIFIEALRNAIMHGSSARDSSIRVAIKWAADSLALEIVNNAVQESTHYNGSTSLGLRGMQERATALGGSFTFASSAGIRAARLRVPLTGRRRHPPDRSSRP